MQQTRGHIFSTQKLVTVAVLIAMQIVLTRFLSLELGTTIRIGFSFIPLAVVAVLYGPITTVEAAIIADFIGIHLQGKPFDPRFGLTAALTGVVYGICLSRKPLKPWHIVLCTTIVGLFLHLGLNSYWLAQLTGVPFMAKVSIRLVPELVQIVVKPIILIVVLPKLIEVAKNR